MSLFGTRGVTAALRFAKRLTGPYYQSARFGVLVVTYATVLMASRWLAYQFRFEFSVPEGMWRQLLWGALWAIPMKLVLLWIFGQFSNLLSYFSVPDLNRILQSMGIGTLVLLATRPLEPGESLMPLSVIAMDFVFSCAAVGAVRLGFRTLRERYVTKPHTGGPVRRVGIIGAGDAGAMLTRELKANRRLGLVPVAFFDDDATKWKSRVHGVPVIGKPERLLEPKIRARLDDVIIAMPSAPASRIREIIRQLSSVKLKVETVPSLGQLATGQVRVSQLRKVELEDLLGREPVQLHTEDIRAVLKGRSVLVTGAGGSIGSELCRQIAAYGPARLVLVERSEGSLFQIEQELREAGYGDLVEPIVANILDEARMWTVFDRFKPQVVFHAAAHKHVPMMESQPDEAFMNNTVGTVRVAELSVVTGVERLVMISTDKAINPTNVMGTTKRLAEIYLQALSAENPGRTRIMAVRFGNVLGSSGSVVPTFTRQIAAGGPVKVTHPDVTRYFMTIPEAVGLVLQSAAQGTGGEIFVLDMGKPMKIVDLARQMIELNGLRPDLDIEIEFTGLRPGEKLYEELSYEGENITATRHPKIHRLLCEPEPLGRVRQQIDEIEDRLLAAGPNELKRLLERVVPEYRPFIPAQEVHDGRHAAGERMLAAT